MKFTPDSPTIWRRSLLRPSSLTTPLYGNTLCSGHLLRRFNWRKFIAPSTCSDSIGDSSHPFLHSDHQILGNSMFIERLRDFLTNQIYLLIIIYLYSLVYLFGLFGLLQFFYYYGFCSFFFSISVF